MDDRRFDSLTRALAGHRSRRKALRGLLGGGALLVVSRLRLRGADARHGTSGPGDPCRHDDQCIAADAPLVCAWNGFGHDGDLNCCTFDGSRCGDDRGCCGYSICAGGFCSGDGSGFASAGSGGIADASAQGGTVSIGDINSGGNVGNVIDVGDTRGSIYVDGGVVSNTTDLSVDASGGQAIADASGGSGNIAISDGGNVPDYGPGPGCTGYGCDCWQGPNDNDPCDDGLVCCHYANDNSGACLPLYTCTGYGAPGDDCPQYCLPGPSQCPSCVSGYCTWDGFCG
ncbi:MAG: hypothetical protein ACRDJC_08270 [Thermomicrobiales bacterium]